jgi:hypothetical protein
VYPPVRRVLWENATVRAAPATRSDEPVMDGKPGFAFVSAPLAKPHGAAGFSSRPAPPPVLRFARGEERIPSRCRPAAGSAEGTTPRSGFGSKAAALGRTRRGASSAAALNCARRWRAAAPLTAVGGRRAESGAGADGRYLHGLRCEAAQIARRSQSLRTTRRRAGVHWTDEPTKTTDAHTNTQTSKQTDGRIRAPPA